MKYKIHISVHIYSEGKVDDKVLKAHNKHYGILGKDIIQPLRKVNGKEFIIENVDETFNVQQLWDWIEKKIYNEYSYIHNNGILSFIQEYNILEKYLVLKDTPFIITDPEKPLLHFLNIKGLSYNDTIYVQLLLSSNAGTIFDENGIKCKIFSHENSKHNRPHVHIYTQDRSGVFSIDENIEMLEGNIRQKDLNRVFHKIENKKEKLLHYWNECTDGLQVDIEKIMMLS